MQLEVILSTGDRMLPSRTLDEFDVQVDSLQCNSMKFCRERIGSAPCSGFGLSSVGSGTNKVNALAQCRGDLNSTECSTCITTALARVQNYCPFKKNATIWHGKCFLRYSESDFFGEIDEEVKFKIWSIIQNETLPSEFSMQVVEMMSSLRETVRVPLFFASKVMEVVLPEKKLYGLAQCNRDLSSEDCDDCLGILIAALPNATRGASVENWTCNVRYELYPFFRV
ncbi:cysteine-rich repeat secretory protein 38-like [Asparagus officinalis]|uniref:cysteine-rich repeat secretory protein 38-like n=1 Tax=Asparagus officinalis TaxID=4686 RepID=UPI00098E33BA|nr:cysteine-rich repeat secretory protein 38-like [Asparagus officinalis]